MVGPGRATLRPPGGRGVARWVSGLVTRRASPRSSSAAAAAPSPTSKDPNRCHACAEETSGVTGVQEAMPLAGSRCTMPQFSGVCSVSPICGGRASTCCPANCSSCGTRTGLSIPPWKDRQRHRPTPPRRRHGGRSPPAAGYQPSGGIRNAATPAPPGSPGRSARRARWPTSASRPPGRRRRPSSNDSRSGPRRTDGGAAGRVNAGVAPVIRLRCCWLDCVTYRPSGRSLRRCEEFASQPCRGLVAPGSATRGHLEAMTRLRSRRHHMVRSFAGAPPGIRTQNQWIKSPLLCH